MENNILLKTKYAQLYQASRKAIEHIDSGIAERVLREIKRNSVFFGLEKSDPELARRINNLNTEMQIVNFLAISDEEATYIIKNHLLDFFRIDISLEERIEARYNYLGYSEINKSRVILKKAILENEEKLGNNSINRWIGKFEQSNKDAIKVDDAIIRFILEDIEANKLSGTEKNVLKSILHAYNKFLSKKLIDIYDVAATLNNENIDTNNNIPKEVYPELDLTGSASKNVSSITNINDALKKYPETGEQLITSQKIELKNFHEPVRPSIKNWLADYVHLLGYEDHDAIERANYLFHTTNTRHLSESDRERLAYILKSFDEKIPIDVDPARRQIIFNFAPRIPQKVTQQTPPPQTPPSRLRRDTSPWKWDDKKEEKKSFQTDPPDIYEMYRIKRDNPEEKLSAGKLFSPKADSNIQEAKFNFPQKMPFEKAQEHVSRNPVKLPMAITGQAPVNADKSAHGTSTYNVAGKSIPEKSSLQPYRITSSAIRKSEERRPPVNPNNVIDLKNLQ